VKVYGGHGAKVLCILNFESQWKCQLHTVVLAVGRKPVTAITSRPDKFQNQFGCDSEKKHKHQTLSQLVY